MSRHEAPGKRQNRPLLRSSVPFLVHLLLIFLIVGHPVPGINESHYLPKAKHAWNADFAPGDLFLESHDSHLLATASAGVIAQWLPLSAVAWLGRLVSWSLLAFAWRRLCTSLAMSPLISPFALVSWLLGVHYLHWAGEWVVGGFEAKTIAYPLALLGLTSLVRGNWKWVWIWMGCAVAWHPLVGGWAGLSAGIVWLLQPQLKSRLSAQLPWLIIGTLIGLIGAIPAASGLGGPDVVGNVSASQVHVYLRLPHHMSPQLFAPQRHYAPMCALAVLVAATLAYRRMKVVEVPTDSERGMGRLLACAWLSVLFSCVGLAIDLTLSEKRPDIASKLLRFYWFRWSDVAVPLASSLVLWRFLQPAGMGALRANAKSSTTALRDRPSLGRRLAIAAALVLTLAGIGSRIQWDQARIIPPADQLLVESTGRYDINTDRYIDWLAVCQWIRENTPADSLWLTPKYQQSFKWYAQRAEIYCWKDVPQDNASVIEWYHRVQRLMPPRDSSGQIRDWTTDELLDLSKQYGFRWILIDRTFQRDAPLLEIMYPIASAGYYVDNRSFAVFRIPEPLMAQ